MGGVFPEAVGEEGEMGGACPGRGKLRRAGC